MEAAFKVRQMVGGFIHAAEVTVAVEATAGGDEVVVSDAAFDWRRDVYGPHVVRHAPADQMLASEAVEGVQYALQRLTARNVDYRVRVTKICDTQVDTWAGDVKVAAALATCKALGVELEPSPRIGADGPVFPD